MYSHWIKLILLNWVINKYIFGTNLMLGTFIFTDTDIQPEIILLFFQRFEWFLWQYYENLSFPKDLKMVAAVLAGVPLR